MSSAYLELHLGLAAAARSGDDGAGELAPARRAYARSLANDDDDAILDRTVRALAACEDDPCASAAVEGEGFGSAYARALPAFAAAAWHARAPVAWAGVEASLASLGPRSEALFDRAAAELGVRWPERPVRIAVASEVPTPARAAIVPSALDARGSCFVRPKAGERPARLVDCVLVHALRAAPSRARDDLVRELEPRAGTRAFDVLAVHVSAVMATALDRGHASVYRRSALAVEPRAVEWLAREWKSGDASFVARYAAFWRADHEARD